MSRKVVRVSDGKVFNSCDDVSIAYRRSISKDVAYCCDHYIRRVLGEQFEWYEPTEEEKQKDDETKRRKQEEREKEAARNRFKYTPLYKLVYPAAVAVKSTIPAGESIRATDFSKLVIEDLIKRYGMWVTTVNGMTNHFVSYSRLYTKSLGMVLTRIHDQTAHHRTWRIRFDDSIIDEEPLLIDEIPSSNCKKVKYLNTGIIFKSISECAKYTGLPKIIIRAICEETIPYYHIDDMDYKFQYVED